MMMGAGPAEHGVTSNVMAARQVRYLAHLYRRWRHLSDHLRPNTKTAPQCGHGRYAEGAGIADRTIVLITSDHGGVGKKHGGSTMAEIEIPWILSGPGVAAGRELRKPVRTYDTALTVAYILGVQPSECWIGRPVLEAFNKE